jgi:hypothetical protein
MIRLILPFLLAMLLAGYAGAATVTLTGTCTGQILTPSNNTIYFYLSNTGNGTATNLLIVPRLSGLSTLEQSGNVSILYPNSNVSVSFATTNFSYPGTYVGGFYLQYSQGTSIYTATFPCAYSIGNKTQSLVRVQGSHLTPARFTLSISNFASSPVNTNITVLAPPEFSISPSTINLAMPPFTIENVSFNITSPKISNSFFTLSAIISYVSGGKHYVALSNNQLDFGPPTGGSSPLFLIIATSSVVVVLIVLIAVALVKRRGEKKRKQS